MKYKLLVIGHGRHGKDTACEILQDEYEYSFISSSLYVAEHVMMPITDYPDVLSCYDDRHNNRQFWMDSIKAYNHPDLARLSKEIVAEYDIYCGLRDYDEFKEARVQGVFDYVIGVDASERISYRDPTFQIPMSECDYIVDNNHDAEHLASEIGYVLDRLQ